jgi:2'-5' RNA ligase
MHNINLSNSFIKHYILIKFMKAKGHSLWLQPKGTSYLKFKKIIKRLSTKYRAPLFEPHITLLGDITEERQKVITKAQQLAKVKAFDILLNKVTYMDEYFRCVLVLAQKSDELVKLNKKAQVLFNRENKEFLPHVSLMYGLLQENVKRRIVRNLKINQRFTADSISVVYTDGPPEIWKVIKDLPLKS